MGITEGMVKEGSTIDLQGLDKILRRSLASPFLFIMFIYEKFFLWEFVWGNVDDLCISNVLVLMFYAFCIFDFTIV